MKRYCIIAFLSGLFLLTFVQAQEAESSISNVVNASGEVTGFFDESGLYHEFSNSAQRSDLSPGSLGTSLEASELSQAGSSKLAEKAVPNTIDRMTVGDTSNNTYSSGGTLRLIPNASVYYLNNNTSWSSGAGGCTLSSASIDKVEESGNILRFYLKNPTDWSRTDYNSGDHSAQGTLRPLAPLVIEATAGSTTGVLRGSVLLVSNTITSYGEPRFNYFSAPVGAVLPLTIQYTLANTTFRANLFNSSFNYTCSGWVDFANPVSIPLPVSMVIQGSPNVFENSTVHYDAVVTFDNGAVKTVTEEAVWQASEAFVSVNQGVLSTGAILDNSAKFKLLASYTYGGVTVGAELDVTCLTEDSMHQGLSWPMFQGNKEHNGALPLLLNTATFSKKWERNFGRAINPVTAADGRVFVSTPSRFQSGDSLFALDSRDGEIIWSKDLGTASSVNPPSYAYGNVYIQTGKGTSNAPPAYVSAFDAETGADVFRSTYSAQWESHYAPTIYKGHVYVNGGYYGGMYCYDAFDGTQKWIIALNQYDQWTPAVDELYAYAYVGESSGGTANAGLRIVDRLTGALIHTIFDPQYDWNGWSMNLAPVLGTQNDIITGHDGRLLCFDLVQKTIKYSISGYFTNQPSVADGRIYIINNGKLDVRDEATGEQLWTWAPPEGTLSRNVIVTNNYALACTASKTYGIELLGRDADWSYPAAGYLALSEDILYIASSSGILTAIATPEYIPAVPVKLDIQGPDTVLESSQNAYQAVVTYSDGRVRTRTDLCTWSARGTSAAVMDNPGSLNVGELLYPQETTMITAEYRENNGVVSASRAVPIKIGCSVKSLVERNAAGALTRKQQILVELKEAMDREQAAMAILRDYPKYPLDMTSTTANSIRNQVYAAYSRDIFSNMSVMQSTNYLQKALDMMNPASLYTRDRAMLMRYFSTQGR